jgi:hypothetical protein
LTEFVNVNCCLFFQAVNGSTLLIARQVVDHIKTLMNGIANQAIASSVGSVDTGNSAAAAENSTHV